VETLGVAVLPGASRLDVQRFDVDPTQPAPDCLGDELGPVIRAHALWNAAHQGTRSPRILREKRQVPIRATQNLTQLAHRSPLLDRI
jgi:hypothetical protein